MKSKNSLAGLGIKKALEILRDVNIPEEQITKCVQTLNSWLEEIEENPNLIKKDENTLIAEAKTALNKFAQIELNLEIPKKTSTKKFQPLDSETTFEPEKLEDDRGRTRVGFFINEQNRENK